MQYDAYPARGRSLRAPRRRRRTGRWIAAALAAAIGAASWVGTTKHDDPPRIASVTERVGNAPARPAAARAVREDHAWMLDPTPALSTATPGFASAIPTGKGFRPQAAKPAEPRTASIRPEPVRPSKPPREVAAIQPAPVVPFPVPRPADLRAPAAPPAAQQAAAPPVVRPVKVAALAPVPADNRSFFEKLFGARPSAGPALGYAALGQDPVRAAPDAKVNLPAPAAGGGTAVYDISARVVVMPNGERLEAHSGLGSKLDDPRYVHVRMQGATPPGTYDLTEREALFHGVRAIRLNPVGGSAAIYGRTGILAHTYLLGPNGDSNGCVSIKDYDRFLQAFLRGEVKRLVVVPGRGGDILPNIAGSGSGPSRLSTLLSGGRS